MAPWFPTFGSVVFSLTSDCFLDSTASVQVFATPAPRARRIQVGAGACSIYPFAALGVVRAE